MKKLEAIIVLTVIGIPLVLTLVIIGSLILGHPLPIGDVAQIAACF